MHSETPRIAIVRLGAIGDVVLNLPVLCALRDHFPKAFLTWIVEKPAAPLLAGHAALDRLITLPRGWLKSPKTVWSLRRELHALRFDAALDLQGLSKSSIAAWLSGAPRRIGFTNAQFEGRELSRSINTELIAPAREHVVERGLELLKALDIERPDARFDLPIGQTELASASRTIDQLNLHTGYAVLNPGAGWPSKLWPAERFASVARHLGQTHCLPSLIVWAGDKEHAWAEQIVLDSAGHARLAPRTSLIELAALAQKARLFIGSDTGPLHIAAAVGTPCIGLFGPMSAKRCGPYGAHNIALQETTLTGSSRSRRMADNASMRLIQAEQVCIACDQILTRRGATRCV